MFRVMLAAMDVIPAAVVLVPVFLILYATVYRRNLRKSILYCLFSLYLAAVFSLVGIPNVTYIRMGFNLNLIPLLGMADDITNSALNVLLFIPLGFQLPVLWRKFRVMRSTVLFGLGMSLTIELLQMLTYRATDINDLITNGFGTLLGYLLAAGLIKRSPRVRDAVNEKKTGELYGVWAITFGVMFFLHPFLSSAIWDRVL